MSNVLPQEDIKKTIALTRARFILILACMIAICALVAIASLMPAYISVRFAHAEVMRAMSGVEVSASAKEDQAIAVRTQSITKVLTPLVMATSSPSEAIASALAAKPADISITAITYAKGMITFTGSTKSRDSVNEYRDRLIKDPHFTNVAIPVSALVGAQEGKLTITLRGSF